MNKPKPIYMQITKMFIMYRKCLVILVFMLLIGCGQNRDSQANENYRVGSEGLRMYFEPGQPPARIYDDSDFNVVMRIENKGAYDVGRSMDRLYLSGFDPTIITGISTYGEPLPPLEGKSLYNQEGTFNYVSFKGVPTSLYMHDVDKYPFNMLATLCYQYKTVMSENVCVDMDPFERSSRQKACTPTNIGSGSQGAPVAVSTVEVESNPGITRFKIHISNVGGGSVYLPGAEYLNKCSPYDPDGLMFDEIDFVRLNKVEVSGINILSSCKPLDPRGGNLIRLSNGQAKILCEIRGSRAAPAFVTPLVVELEYGYRNIIQTYINMIGSQ